VPVLVANVNPPFAMNEAIPRREFLRRSACLGAALTGAAVLPRLAAAATAAAADLAIVEGADYFSDTLHAVELLGGIRRFVPPGARVGLLLNAPRWWTKPGSFTSPEVGLAVVKLCADVGAREIVLILNPPAGYWDRPARAAALAKERALVKANAEKWTEVDIPKGRVLKRAEVNQALLDCDVFINVPISKHHEGTGFSGCLKNMMGACARKTNLFFHNGSGAAAEYADVPHLSQCIADANLIRKPDLCVCDSTEFLLTNGPAGPGEVRMARQVVAGANAVTVDAYACTLLGLRPADVSMITMAAAHGLGPFDLAKLNVRKASI
jgi:uncharacterized protein (DUF362 family)